MKIHEIDSWPSLREKLFETNFISTDNNNGRRYAHNKIFRGQKNPSWALESKLERLSQIKHGEHHINLKTDNGPGWYQNECSLILNSFKKNLRKLSSEYDQISDIDAWILGRHYGLNTPYLDWTTSPFKAIYFAFAEIYESFEFRMFFPHKIESSVAIFKLNLWEDLFTENEFEILRTVNPIGSRMNAQSGCFTILKTDHRNMDEYLESIGKSDYLEKFIINGKLATEILSYLHEIEIDTFSLFPDLTGAALHANINMTRLYAHFQMTK